MRRPFSSFVAAIVSGPRHGCHAIGDCDDCGHSIAYHLPFVGCTKCSCDEYS